MSNPGLPEDPSQQHQVEMRYLLSYVILVVIADYARSARILAVLPMPFKSHHIMFNAVMDTLAERGHEIVHYTPFPPEKPRPNHKVVQLDKIPTLDQYFTRELLMDILQISQVGITTMLWMNEDRFINFCFENKDMRNIIESKEEFDLVVLETFFGQETLLGLGHKFKAPVVTLHPFGSFSLLSKAAGNPLSLSFIPDLGLPSTDHMSFYERAISAYSILSPMFQYYTQYLPAKDDIVKRLFKDPTMPPVVDMLHNISLFVNNAHPSVQYAQPYTPNLIPIGGIHLAKDRKPLPPDMKKFLDEAPLGVVYVSLGSILPDHLLPPEFFENFLSVFRRLPQKVLWKTGHQPPALPSNVMTSKWMPQQDILAHPNVVLFMTHGGLFGEYEAISSGVPVVCIPFFGDQPYNARFYEEKQVGVKLSFFDILSSADAIYSAVTTVLNNPKYKENMKKLSAVYHDRPMSPRESLVYWVEYVLNHNGSPHLRSVSASLSWYQLALVDVVAAILVAVSLLLTTLYVVVRRVLRLFWTSNTKPVSKTKKTN